MGVVTTPACSRREDDNPEKELTPSMGRMGQIEEIGYCGWAAPDEKRKARMRKKRGRPG
jgi:hypothetical protein